MVTVSRLPCVARLTRGRTILYAPFTPFIVLFCHVIETSDAEDLRRLDRFAAGLQPVLSVSRAVEKLHGLCRLLSRVAALYVETKARRQDQDLSMVGDDIDMILSRLGFISHGEQPGMSTGAGGGSGPEVPAADQTPQLGEWFSGNRYVMGLMEDDLLDFDPGLWSTMAL